MMTQQMRDRGWTFSLRCEMQKPLTFSHPLIVDKQGKAQAAHVGGGLCRTLPRR
jgi:hypothetical protein